jgi:hypothetical protein
MPARARARAIEPVASTSSAVGGGCWGRARLPSPRPLPPGPAEQSSSRGPAPPLTRSALSPTAACAGGARQSEVRENVDLDAKLKELRTLANQLSSAVREGLSCSLSFLSQAPPPPASKPF